MKFQEHLDCLLRVPSEPTYPSFSQWQASVPGVVKTRAKKSYWLMEGEKCIPLEKLVYQLLISFAQGQAYLGQLLAGLDVALERKLLSYLKSLQANGLIDFYDPGRPWKPNRGWIVAGAPPACATETNQWHEGTDVAVSQRALLPGVGELPVEIIHPQAV